ncbi:MAG TPA: SDR family NAD(P)-dependent oxidoreductase [Kofleriaceae bacterium]|nr:SDR family NAD(P)-dependent oxidoreductase [Kofleriaceae bacterium]
MAAIQDQVVVVTGASSGLGRALALELAGRGARLVLAARRLDELEATARRCRAQGADALVVQTDVRREADVQKLAEAAMEQWGQIDVWINNAGVTLFALLEQDTFEAHQRVIETNLFGSMHGARAVVPIFRRQHHGVLINVGSVLSEVGQAFVPSYVISKFGVRGLSETLRVELADEPDIHVCTVMPYAIDTPHFEVAPNSTGRTPFAMPPVQEPEAVARVIADLVEKPRRTRRIPRFVGAGLVAHALFPRLVEHVLLDALRRWHLAPELPERTSGRAGEGPRERAHIHGERRPRLGTPRLIAWALVRVARIEAGNLWRHVRGRTRQLPTASAAVST